MRPLKLIALGLLAWPAAEIAALICASMVVGVANALLLMFLMSFVGVLILRHFSGSRARLQAAGRAGIAGAILDETGMAPGVGGILLVIPGFITSVLGLLVMFPVSRRWLWACCRRLLAAKPPPPSADVIDLAPSEWQPLPSPKLPRTNGQPED